MSEEVEHEIPERVYLKACHPASPSRNCTWSISQTPQDSVEYIRAQPPTADAEMVANQIVAEFISDGSRLPPGLLPLELRNRITTALSAARQQGRDEQREKDGIIILGSGSNTLPLVKTAEKIVDEVLAGVLTHVEAVGAIQQLLEHGLEKYDAAIRSNQ